MDTDDIILLGQALGLLRSKIKKMKRLPDDMIDAWLIQADDVPTTSSPPSWLSLCKALDKISQPGIAQNIRQNGRCIDYNGLFHFLLVHPPLMTNRCSGGQTRK